jgi:hypothetical protein
VTNGLVGAFEVGAIRVSRRSYLFLTAASVTGIAQFVLIALNIEGDGSYSYCLSCFIVIVVDCVVFKGLESLKLARVRPELTKRWRKQEQRRRQEFRWLRSRKTSCAWHTPTLRQCPGPERILEPGMICFFSPEYPILKSSTV